MRCTVREYQQFIALQMHILNKSHFILCVVYYYPVLNNNNFIVIGH